VKGDRPSARRRAPEEANAPCEDRGEGDIKKNPSNNLASMGAGDEGGGEVSPPLERFHQSIDCGEGGRVHGQKGRFGKGGNFRYDAIRMKRKKERTRRTRRSVANIKIHSDPGRKRFGLKRGRKRKMTSTPRSIAPERGNVSSFLRR